MAEEYFRHELRIVQLAELIFNLQEADGIDERIDAIKEGDLEPTYGELECAAQIQKANVPFRFIVRSGNKRNDYDVEILPSSNNKLNCEMKVTTEEQDLSRNKIINKLHKARGQFPAAQPGMIFLKIPESWSKQGNAQTILSECLREFLRSTN